jgi:hypothetical protein
MRFFAEHKDAEGLVICAETGERIGRDEGHMDHRAPLTFEFIVTTFLANCGMALEHVPITSGRGDKVSPEITDPVLAEAFRQYHARVALLDFVKSATNLAQSARLRMKSARMNLA